MKALSLWQPWATLIAIEAKRFETRGWSTSYRGPLAIHATAKPIARSDVTPAIGKALYAAGYDTIESLPLRAIVCVVDLVEILPTATAPQSPFFVGDEREFGDYGPHRFAWRLENVRRIDNLRYQGAQGLWDIPDLLLQEALR